MGFCTRVLYSTFERGTSFFPTYLSVVIFLGYLGVGGCRISHERKQTLTVRPGHFNGARENAGSSSEKRRGHLCAINVLKFRRHFVRLGFSVDSF